MSDTIAAIATAPGPAGIAVVRISGEQSFWIANKIFVGKIKPSDVKSHTIHYGSIYNPKTKQLIDEVLLAVYKSPNSYTGEDMVEIFCHGGDYVSSLILDIVISNGARLAEPGEFTKRRVLAGKMDITQAEAVLDLVQAHNAYQHQLAIRQLQGSLSSYIANIQTTLVTLISHLEHLLEFEEDGKAVKSEYQRLLSKIKKLRLEIEDLLAKNKELKFLRSGVICPIIGRPNVGKSSLFNRLCEAERAIVTEIPGTTRDSLEASVFIQGIAFHFIDTAGLKTIKNAKGFRKIEAIGIEKTKDWLENADLVLGVFDNSSRIQDQDEMVFNAVKTKPHIWVLNKIDLKPRFNRNIFNGDQICLVSAKFNVGIENLKKTIARWYLKNIRHKVMDDILLLNHRHINVLSQSVVLIKNAENAGYLDATLLDLRKSLDLVGTITNPVNNEEILDAIFKQFCIGK
ncbi:MAG: tRNA uridine-5-carboxymethylaminomethyl(34) synthesis GTPase MnmE [candidate division WOR-3 bacterium]|nr:tRNA uridine-5-carboxymethylaminomethyl(34) synthesis GTPase MnmE [candidate division WOR-3 bacterium]